MFSSIAIDLLIGGMGLQCYLAFRGTEWTWEKRLTVIIPIVGMLLLVFFFTYLGLREGRRYDRLMEQDRFDEILDDMQK